MPDPLYTFEVEHLLPQEFWNATEADSEFHDVYQFLLSMGLTSKDQLGNLMGLYSNDIAVGFNQSQGVDNRWRNAILDTYSQMGLVVHRGGPGDDQLGFQRSKRDFLAEEIRAIASAPGSAEAKMTAFWNLVRFTSDLAKGHVLGENGMPLGVMGDTAQFKDDLTAAFVEGYFVAPIDFGIQGTVYPFHRHARQIGILSPDTLSPDTLSPDTLSCRVRG